MKGRCRMRILTTATVDSFSEEELLAEGIRLMEKPLSPMELHAVLLECCDLVNG